MEGPLAIQEGRHPIAELRVDGAFQSNSVFMSEAAAVHIIGCDHGVSGRWQPCGRVGVCTPERPSS